VVPGKQRRQEESCGEGWEEGRGFFPGGELWGAGTAVESLASPPRASRAAGEVRGSSWDS